jgi:hypothetical protein
MPEALKTLGAFFSALLDAFLSVLNGGPTGLTYFYLSFALILFIKYFYV